MLEVRRFLLANRSLAALLVAAALAVKLFVPAGYMLQTTHGRMVVAICSGTGARMMVVSIPGLADDAAGHDSSQQQAAAEMPCTFSGASVYASGATDPVLLGGAIAFIMVLSLARAPVPAVHPAPFLRPPPHGPPSNLLTR